jgi:serine/threonine protein kinase
VGKVIGKGAFGKVNLAIHKLSGKFVALKSINKQLMNEEVTKRKIFHEFNIMRITAHTNIVKLLEQFDTPHHTVFVTEVCGGGDLLSYVRKRRRLKEDVACHLFGQLI